MEQGANAVASLADNQRQAPGLRLYRQFEQRALSEMKEEDDFDIRSFRIGEKKSSGPDFEGQSIRVKKVIDPVRDRELDHDLVCAIAESAKITGIIHPIAVRRVSVDNGSEVRHRTVLVAGAHRLAAAGFLSHDRIPCRYVEGDDEFVQLVQLSEDLFRKHLTVLRRSELLAKWYRLISTQDDISGQVGQKSTPGRRPSGISRAARKLPIGRSEEARRKIIQRANQIDRLHPQTKAAVISAGLDDNQHALVAIAEAHRRKAQLRKVALLTPPSQDKHGTPVEQGTDSKTAANEPHNRRQNSANPDHPETSLEQLEEVWEKEGRKLWMYAPLSVREPFLAMLRRARCKAHTDAVQFVRDVFQGRNEVFARNLYDLAKRRGLVKKSVQAVLKQLCYHRTRPRHDPSSGWRYRNRDKHWKDQTLVISNAELLNLRKPHDSAQPSESAKSEALKPPPVASDWETDDYFGKI